MDCNTVIQGAQQTCPEYILPDNLPDLKPDLKLLKVKDEGHDPLTPDIKPSKVKDEQHDPITTSSSTAADAPGCVTSSLTVPLRSIKEEVVVGAATSSSVDDDPASSTPGLTMSVKIKEEAVSAATSPSSDHARDNRAGGGRKVREVNEVSVNKRLDRMEGILGKILSKMEGIARTQQTILEAVRENDGKVRRHMKRMHDIRELEELDLELGRNPGMKAAMREQLSRLCSADLRTSVKHIMTALFSPELAKQLSAKGQNNKKGLVDTHIFDVLLDTLFMVWKATRQDVCRLVSRWLSGARDRRVGAEPARKKRVLQPTATSPFERSPESAGGSAEPAEPASDFDEPHDMASAVCFVAQNFVEIRERDTQL